MLKIWGRTNSVNVQKVLWCLAELDVPYERVDAGLAYGKNDEPWYLALNPNGRVPLLQDGDFSLWESNTIVRYLASKHGLGRLCPKPLETRAHAERWMDWQLSVLVNPVSIVFWNLIRTPATGPDRRGDREVDERGEPRVRDPRRAFDDARVRGGRALLDGRHSGRRDRAPLACADRRRAAAAAGARSLARAPGGSASAFAPTSCCRSAERL